ncbi:hypothetical protein V6N11_037152 [Hibiscus sabdariffa]|uniref:Uncharacterized protein n=1 Tax=Hibiscus sabdariffa TaxID=183260 RepID=A0ABR2P0M2_9ROSI
MISVVRELELLSFAELSWGSGEAKREKEDEAAVVIERTFRAYLIRRASEERQRFSERIISLIQVGTDIMVRGGRRSMLDELEAIDPHPIPMDNLKRHAGV